MTSSTSDNARRHREAADNDRRAAITILCALGLFGWFIGTFLYWAMGPGSFHVLETEARIDLSIGGGLGTLALISAATLAVIGWRRQKLTPAPAPERNTDE